MKVVDVVIGLPLLAGWIPLAVAKADLSRPAGMTASNVATSLFADIAGFTAVTAAHGDDDDAALVADFCAAVSAELPAFGGTQVKCIGDALMLRVPEPADAVRLGLHIVHDLMPGHGAPAVR